MQNPRDVPGRPIVRIGRDGKQEEMRTRCRHCDRLTSLRVEKSYSHAPKMALMGFFTLGVTWLFPMVPNEKWRCASCGKEQ